MPENDKNREVWRSQKVATTYTGHGGELQKPEAEIFRQLADRLPQMDMLDLGVGAGRTALALATKVQTYTGVDYSESMIAECVKRFGPDSKARFFSGDARDLSQFADASFDLVLFSFNGLDYVDHTGRTKVFNEVKRVLRKGGTFCFSSHNLNHDASSRYNFVPQLAPLSMLRSLRNWAKFRLLNPGYKKKCLAPSLIVIDGEGLRNSTYCIRSEEQLAQLSKHGFEAIRIFALDTGLEIKPAQAAESTDPWLYYLAKRD